MNLMQLLIRKIENQLGKYFRTRISSAWKWLDLETVSTYFQFSIQHKTQNVLEIRDFQAKLAYFRWRTSVSAGSFLIRGREM